MNPLFDRSGEMSQYIGQKKQEPIKDPKTSSISQEIFEKMQQPLSKEAENEDKDLLAAIGDKIAEHMSSIPSDSPFADSDMVVVKDNFRGYIPLNGIRESALTDITRIYNEILNGGSKIQVEGDDKFKKEVLVCINTLMTREIGRKLIKKLLDLSKETKIRFGDVNSAEKGANIIFFNQDVQNAIFGLHSSGKLKYYIATPFICLAHEMIHLAFPDRGAKSPPTLDFEGAEYHNLEEQAAIVGLTKSLSIGQKILETSDEDDWDAVDVHDYYYELNERNIHAAFANTLKEFYPRMGHLGIADLPNTQLDELIEILVKDNVMYDLEKLFKEHSITKEKLNEMFDPGELHMLAIKEGKLEALQYLMKLDPHPKLPAENSLLIQATLRYKDFSKQNQLIDLLLKYNVDVNFHDRAELTPLHFLTRLGNAEAIQKLINHGADVHIKGPNNQEVLDYAFSKYNPTSASSAQFVPNLKALFQVYKNYYPEAELLEKFRAFLVANNLNPDLIK